MNRAEIIQSISAYADALDELRAGVWNYHNGTQNGWTKEEIDFVRKDLLRISTAADTSDSIMLDIMAEVVRKKNKQSVLLAPIS
jgi:hypothetical protein